MHVHTRSQEMILDELITLAGGSDNLELAFQRHAALWGSTGTFSQLLKTIKQVRSKKVKPCPTCGQLYSPPGA